MELLGQGSDGLGKQGEALHGDGKLAAAGAHHRTFGTDPVAHVQVLHLLEQVFAQGIDAAEQLDVVAGIAQDDEHDLALVADRHDAAGNLHLVFGGGTVFQVGIQPVQLIDVMGIAVCAAIGVLALGQKRLALREADLAGIVFHEVGNLGSLHGFVAHLLPFDIGRVMPL